MPSSKICSLVRARASNGMAGIPGLILSLEMGDFLILFPLSLEGLRTSPWVFPVASRTDWVQLVSSFRNLTSQNLMHTIPTGLPEHTGLSWALGTSRNIFPDALMRQSPPPPPQGEHGPKGHWEYWNPRWRSRRFSPIFWSKQTSLDLSAQSKCQQSLASIPIEVLDEAY